jgi:hypothetical protein
MLFSIFGYGVVGGRRVVWSSHRTAQGLAGGRNAFPSRDYPDSINTVGAMDH